MEGLLVLAPSVCLLSAQIIKTNDWSCLATRSLLNPQTITGVRFSLSWKKVSRSFILPSVERGQTFFFSSHEAPDCCWVSANFDPVRFFFFFSPRLALSVKSNELCNVQFSPLRYCRQETLEKSQREREREKRERARERNTVGGKETRWRNPRQSKFMEGVRGASHCRHCHNEPFVLTGIFFSPP